MARIDHSCPKLNPEISGKAKEFAQELMHGDPVDAAEKFAAYVRALPKTELAGAKLTPKQKEDQLILALHCNDPIDAKLKGSGKKVQLELNYSAEIWSRNDVEKLTTARGIERDAEIRSTFIAPSHPLDLAANDINTNFKANLARVSPDDKEAYMKDFNRRAQDADLPYTVVKLENGALELKLARSETP